ncbi:MAG: metal ABC transporter permease, partial [Patescibacteria group bacterium]
CDGMAHVSLGGRGIATIAAWQPLPVALIWTMLAALIIYWLERNTKLPSDAIIGILFTASMALGIIIFETIGSDMEELEEALFGGLNAISGSDLWMILGLGAVILAWLFVSHRKLTLMGLSEDLARASGVNIQTQTIILYLSLAATTVLGAKVLGVVLVSALLIIPASISRLITHSFRSYTIVSLIVAELVMLSGILVAYKQDLSPGPVTILIGAGLFIVLSVVQASRIIKTK